MNINRNAITVILCLLFFSLLVSCNSSSDDDDTTASTTTDTSTDTSTTAVTLSATDLFYQTMQETTPVYSPISAGGASFIVPVEAWINGEAGTWGSGSGILYSVYFTLRDFQSPRDEGVVDRSNLYKLLFDAEEVLSGAYELVEALPTPKTIASPFASMDTSATVFTHASNSIVVPDEGDEADDEAAAVDENPSIAFKITDGVIEALVTWACTEESLPNKAERGIAYYTYDKATGVINIDMVYSVDYDTTNPESTYNLRCKATGNITDHSFQFNYIIGDNKIIAKGVSQGTDNYVIFKYTNGQTTGYLKVPADSGEAFFKNIFDTGVGAETDPDLIADPQNYLDWIDAQAFMGASDLLSSTEQLNVGLGDLAGTLHLSF